MRALVVFESMFGNTEVIARAVAEGLSSRIPVDVVEVSAAPKEIGADVALLVVGGPTHAFGMSRVQTRQDATKQALGHVVSQGEGIREWLGDVTCPVPVPAVAFDTRISKGWVPGSASRGARKRLRARGFTTTSEPKSFYVQGVSGPLTEGQASRAHQWGEQLALGLTATGQRSGADGTKEETR
jgi:hypothetical protein